MRLEERSDEALEAPDPWGVHGTDPWYFCVRLAGARYAFPAAQASEVVRLGPMTRLPAAPAFLPGVFQHRGEVLPILDVAALVGEPPMPPSGGTRVVIAATRSYRVALLAEAIEGLVQVADEHLEPPPAGNGGMLEFVEHAGIDGKGPLAIIDLDRLVEVARQRSEGM